MTITAGQLDAHASDAGSVRTVIIDDHQLLAESLAVALQMEGLSCSIMELQDRETLLREVLALAPQLVLLDLDLGGDLGDGAELVAPLVEAGAPVLVVSASTDPDQLCRALEHGAMGLLAKAAPFQQLLEAVLAAARGDEVMPPAERRRILDVGRSRRSIRARSLAPFRDLSVRENHVLRELAEGQSVAVIAQTGFVSEATVRSQVRAVLSKLGCSSQLEAVAAAHRCGWISPSAW
jgi:two-component system nitrate/nitrite response regulator NarL